MKAIDVLKVSDVPSFEEYERNESISNNLKLTPVKDWQRPLINDKREKITKFFNNTGEFMPNPVLISENPEVSEQNPIIITPKIIAGETTEFWEIHINEDVKSLWIIDGQHRIKGLGHDDCQQNQNPIPVVFMLNVQQNNLNYSPTDFAKIFAQVTTSATPLKLLHKEWLEYAFKMGKYVDSTKWVESMRTVIDLCSNPNFEDNGRQLSSHYFYDNIVFNDTLKSDNTKLNCQVLAEIFFTHYYNQTASHNHLTPQILANQIAKAFYELYHTIINPNESVFFAMNSKRHMVMIKSIIKGMLKYLLVNTDPRGHIPLLTDWHNIYNQLNFAVTDWDWSAYTNPNDESWYKSSEILASQVFIVSFEQGLVPDNCNNLQECIVFGNNFSVTFQCSDPNGVIFTENINGNRTINRPGINNIRIIEKTQNAELIKIVDQRTTALFPEWYEMDYSRLDPRKKQSKEGINIPQFRERNTKRPRDYDSGSDFTLEIKRVRYGGQNDSYSVRFII
jgi:hypothetical protein